MTSLWQGMALIGAAGLVLAGALVWWIRSTWRDTTDLTVGDPPTPDELTRRRVETERAKQRNTIEVQPVISTTSHRNLEDETHPIVRSAVAKARRTSGRRNREWEPRWWQSRPGKGNVA